MAILNALSHINFVNIISSYVCLLNHQSKATIPYTSLPTEFLNSVSSPIPHRATPSSPSAHLLPGPFIVRSPVGLSCQLTGVVHSFLSPLNPQFFFGQKGLFADYPTEQIVSQDDCGDNNCMTEVVSHYVCRVSGRKNPSYG